MMTRAERLLHPLAGTACPPPGSAFEILRRDGWVPVHSGDNPDECVGAVKRQGRHYGWQAWKAPIRASSRRKALPEVVAQGRSSKITNAVWSLRNQHRHNREEAPAE